MAAALLCKKPACWNMHDATNDVTEEVTYFKSFDTRANVAATVVFAVKRQRSAGMLAHARVHGSKKKV